MELWQYRRAVLEFNAEVETHNRYCPNYPVAPIPPLLARHHRSMMTEAEIHKGLLAIRDREYRFLLNFFKNAGFDLPLQGPIAYRWAEAEAGAGNVRAQFCAAETARIWPVRKRRQIEGSRVVRNGRKGTLAAGLDDAWRLVRIRFGRPCFESRKSRRALASSSGPRGNRRYVCVSRHVS